MGQSTYQFLSHGFCKLEQMWLSASCFEGSPVNRWATFFMTGALEEFRPLTVVMFFTHLFSFLRPPEENAGSNVFVCFSAHCIITQVQWFLLHMKNGFSRSHNCGWIPSLAVHVFFTSPVLIIHCVFKYERFMERHVKWKAFVVLFKTLYVCSYDQRAVASHWARL